MRAFVKNIAYAGCFALREVFEPFFNFREVSILCYHSISDSTHATAVGIREFESHLALLAKRGYVFVSLADIMQWHGGARTLPRKAVALTFDDGYADFEKALPLLESYHAPAALFVIGGPQEGWDAPLLSPEALERVRRHPLATVGWHSRTHPNLATLSGEGLAEEVRPPAGERFFAYPGGNYSEAAIAAVKAAGYLGACSIKPTLVTRESNPYLLPRNVILRNMRPWQVALRASKAIAWYRALTRLL